MWGHAYTACVYHTICSGKPISENRTGIPPGVGYGIGSNLVDFKVYGGTRY